MLLSAVLVTLARTHKVRDTEGKDDTAGNPGKGHTRLAGKGQRAASLVAHDQADCLHCAV